MAKEKDEAMQIVRQLGGDIRQYEVVEKGKRYLVMMDVSNGVELSRTRLVGAKPHGQDRPPGGRNVEFFKIYRPNWSKIVQEHFSSKGLDFHLIGVFFVLAAFMSWEKGYLYHPGNQRPASESELADMIGFSRSGLHRYIVELEEYGLLAVKRGGGGKPNEIYLNPDIIYFGKYTSTADMPQFNGEFKAMMPVKLTRRPKAEG